MKLLTLFILMFTAGSLWADGTRNVSTYNLSSEGTGLIHHTTAEAYDPVAYFPEGGGVALKGKPQFSVDYKGVEYLFSSQANADLFLTDPAKYEPTYGGWCARAMIVGQYIGIDPELFIINGRRIHFFVSKRAKRFFARNLTGNEKKADGHWKRISGEEARL